MLEQKGLQRLGQLNQTRHAGWAARESVTDDHGILGEVAKAGVKPSATVLVVSHVTPIKTMLQFALDAGAGILHRIGAIITFGYFAVHLVNLGYQMFFKGQKGFLWGWRSMVPQLTDVKDFIANMKYFLYLGPKPKFDRFTYWEKFDYLAVFWGVAMIGVSGLMLWFPEFFARVLPGWVLNAAYIIHSDEALLATGFIFLFHFFHTHLRPEAFPMDPVIFTGSMPLHRFKEERPFEYERMVKEGTLEQHLRQQALALDALVTGDGPAVLIDALTSGEAIGTVAFKPADLQVETNGTRGIGVPASQALAAEFFVKPPAPPVGR